jgi:hypothetical protein
MLSGCWLLLLKLPLLVIEILAEEALIDVRIGSAPTIILVP